MLFRSRECVHLDLHREGRVGVRERLKATCRGDAGKIDLAPVAAPMKRWMQKIKGFVAQVFNVTNAPVNLDAASMVNDIDEAAQPLDSGIVAYGHHTSVILVRGPDSETVHAHAREAIKACEFRGFSARAENRNGMEAFLGSLPGNGYENVRRPMISPLNFSDIMESTTDWTGEPYCVTDKPAAAAAA